MKIQKHKSGFQCNRWQLFWEKKSGKLRISLEFAGQILQAFKKISYCSYHHHYHHHPKCSLSLDEKLNTTTAVDAYTVQTVN